MQPGIYSELSNDTYHGGPGTSKSLLDLIDRSPMHYRAVKDAANDNREPTAAQAVGTALHALVLEPEAFRRDYVRAISPADVPDAISDRDVLVGMVAKLNESRLPKLPTSGSKAEQIQRIIDGEVAEFGAGRLDAAALSTPELLNSLKAADLKAIIDGMNEHRQGLLSVSGSSAELAAILRANGVPVTLWAEIRAAWLEENGHRQVLTEDVHEQLQGMRDAVMAHPAAHALLTGAPGKAEQSVYWIDEETGELCRCRPDWWRDDGIVVDVKTTEDASPEGFAKSIANWRYHVQQPFYTDGINTMIAQTGLPIVPIKAFVFLVVEKKPPYAVAVYSLAPEAVELGRIEYRKNLATLHACNMSGKWPGYGENIMPISLPAWVFSKTLSA